MHLSIHAVNVWINFIPTQKSSSIAGASWVLASTWWLSSSQAQYFKDWTQYHLSKGCLLLLGTRIHVELCSLHTALHTGFLVPHATCLHTCIYIPPCPVCSLSIYAIQVFAKVVSREISESKIAGRKSAFGLQAQKHLQNNLVKWKQQYPSTAPAIY